MKYVVLLCDGMADTPCPALGGMTPMEKAHKPAMDSLVSHAEIGLVRTVQEGMSPGSDVANLTVMGYDTRQCYTGRSPLEAANIGIELSDEDVALRCNLVTLSEDEPYEEKTLLDYCAGDISTEEADQLIEDMPKIEQLWVPDDRQREARYKEAMNTCDYRAWVSIVKTLYIRKQERTAQGKKITALDERYMRTAENELYSELSLTLGIPKDEMEQYIRERLTQ